jgi:hypothetical protein
MAGLKWIGAWSEQHLKEENEKTNLNIMSVTTIK